jgi:uncharacterized membrane protein
LTLQRFAGFDGAVYVSVEGLPASLTATVDPFAAGSNTTTLQISASEQEFGGTYQLTVRTEGTGIQQASTGLAVEARPMPQFHLFFPSPPRTSLPVTITRGANATIPLAINRVSEYSLPVSLSVMGVPPGVTRNLPTTIPSSTTSQTFDIAISISADAVPGVYAVTIRGEASTFTRDVTIALTVN